MGFSIMMDYVQIFCDLIMIIKEWHIICLNRGNRWRFMSFHINLPDEEVFDLLIKYFVGRRIRIISVNKPSYIKVEVGKLFSMWFEEAQGIVDINIVRLNEHSLINLHFNFSKEYISGLILSLLLSLVLYIYGLFVDAPGDLLFLLIVTIFGVTMALEIYNVAVTKKKFVEELSLFVQSTNLNKEDIHG